MANAIEAILAAREKQQADQKPEPQALPEERFYSLVRIEGQLEEFLEVRFKNGSTLCLAYKDLAWFNFSREDSSILMAFGMILVLLTGRGLAPRLFDLIRARRVAWIKEAEETFQDCPDFDCFLESIVITVGDSTES